LQDGKGVLLVGSKPAQALYKHDYIQLVPYQKFPKPNSSVGEYVVKKSFNTSRILEKAGQPLNGASTTLLTNGSPSIYGLLLDANGYTQMPSERDQPEEAQLLC
jgi:hypothetical protein